MSDEEMAPQATAEVVAEPKEDFKHLPFADKLSRFREEVQKCDWSNDRFLSLPGNKGYPYLSSDKVRQNIAPILAKYGLEYEVDFSELEVRDPYGNVTNHWSIKLKGTIKDFYSGQEYTSTVYGENGSSDDKGIGKSETAAIKKWFMSTQLIAEGLDEVADAYTSAGGHFVKRTPEEEAEVKSKVLGSGVPPSPKPAPKKPTPAAKPEPKKPAEEPAKPAQEAPKAEKAEEPVKEEKPAQEPAKAPVEGMPDLPEGISAIHRNAISKIVEKWTADAKAGKVDAEKYNEMSMACASIKVPGDAVRFIRAYQGA